MLISGVVLAVKTHREGSADRVAVQGVITWSCFRAHRDQRLGFRVGQAQLQLWDGDGARYHTSREMHAFFTDHPDRLTVYQLPSYSPDYNPIEYVWKKVKTKAMNNCYFAQFSKLVSSVETALSSFDEQPQEILHLMGFYTQSFASSLVA